MEAVPRLPMICFDLKISPDRPPTEFNKLKQYIREFYNEDPETYSTEIRNIESLRAQAIHPVKDVNGCSILKKYYCQLHFLQSRFPLSKGSPLSIGFTWRDVYSGAVCTVMDIKYEIVAILYNIGALHSQMGASDDRTTPEGLKMACTHFQCAAWAFQHIKDSYAQPSGMDLSPDLMQFMYHISLAQAQECILEKSMTDNRKATINARVANQIVDYYNLADNALVHIGSEENVTDVVGCKQLKNWKRYMRFKSTYYHCISLLYQGMQSDEQQKMGERVAYYQASLDKLNEAIKLSKGLHKAQDVSESLLFTRDVVECKRKAAKSENEFIYHEEVVDIDLLPAIKGASLVKGISFNINDPDISGPDIFSRLVPMKAHEASSLYSEEKAKLLRRINGMIDSKDEEVVSFMSCLQLEYLKAHLESSSLPQEVVDRCAALSVKPDAIPNLIAAMDKLNDAYHDVDAMLQQILQLIKVEDKNEKEYEEVMGARAPSIVATDLTREANKYMEAHKKAADSNETLNRAMSQHVENLRVLQQSLPQLQNQLPSLTPLKLDENECLKEVTLLVGKVDEMRKQRATLASQLRESICSDDITTILVTRVTDNLQSLFEDELKKHEKYVKIIEQNLSAQENILNALTDAYARYAPTRKATAEIIKQRELMLSALVSSYDAYEDLIAKSSKGMEFYRKLETNLTKLLQRVKGTCKVQQEEREAILMKNNIKIGQEPVVNPEPVSTGPKLKDYLTQKRKEAQGYGGGSSVNYPIDAGQTWLPGVRPAPVGSEVTQPLIGSAKPHEYSTPINAFPGTASTPYHQTYGNYQPAQIPHQASFNNLQYPTISDHATPVDSAPTAPYRPDSRASTSSEHSVTMQQYSEPTSVAPNTPLTEPKASPLHTIDNNQAVITTVKKQDPIPSPNPPSVPTPQYPSSAQSYQYPAGYAYPQAYTPDIHTSIAGNTYAQPPSSYLKQQPALPISQVPNQYDTNPYMSAGHVNNVVYQPQVPSYGAQPANVYHANPSNTLVSHGTSYSGADSQVIAPTYYNPSQAKAMNVPSASYNGPYGSNTVTSPYANYYTSQVYNGNVSSIGTEKNTYIPQSTVSSVQPNVSSSESNNVTNAYTPNKNNQVPTTTYTVPALHQSDKSNYTPSTQPYMAPSLVSPTQTTFNISASNQLPQAQIQHGEKPAEQTPGHVTSQSTSKDTPASYPISSTQVPTSTNYQYSNTALTSYASQYSNYYYSRGQSDPGYAYQTPDQVPYHNYNTQYYPPAQQLSSYTPNQNVAINYPYDSGASSHYQAYPSSYTPTDQTAPVTNKMSNQNVSNYSQSQTNTYSKNNPTQEVSQLNYSQPVQNYGLPNQNVQPYQSTMPQQQTPSTYVHPTQDSNYMPLQQHGPMYRPDGHPTDSYLKQSSQTGYSTSNQQTLSQNQTVYSTPQPSSSQASQHKSNVDLLAGLDFNISDAPLQPVVQSIPVSQISDSLSNLNIDIKPMTSVATVTTDGQTKPQMDEPDNELKEEDRNSSTSNSGKMEEAALKPSRDPFLDVEALNQFVQEVDKFEKFVEGLCAKTLSGPTPLDIKWNELQELQDKDAHKQSISVARCYPMKNRFPDILPYDNSTVELPSTKDDYINASFVKNMCTGCPDFILTQAPLPSTFADFWTMILEQHVELVVCLLSDTQLSGEIYWPQTKMEYLTFGHLKIDLQSCNVRSYWVERIISVSNNKSSRVIVHLQFTAWPYSWFPESPGPWLQLVGETLSMWRGCRNPESCIVVHCDAGVGRSGLFVTTATALSEMLLSPHIPEMVPIVATLAKWRKNPLRDRDHLKFAFQIILYYCQDILMKRGILSNKGSFEEKRTKGKSHTRHPSQDFLLNSSSTHASSSEERRHSDSSSTGSRMSEIDPLNQLDPLWQIKRHT